MSLTAFRHLKHGEIDFQKWDETVNSSAYPSLFANTFYLNAVSPGWEGLVFGNYSSVFPLCTKRKYGISYLPQPLFTGQLGLFGTFSEEEEKQVYSFLKEHYRLVDYELNCRHNVLMKQMSGMKTYVIRYGTGILYNQNSKRNIAKAKALHLQVSEVSGKQAMNLSKKHLNHFLKEQLGFGRGEIGRFEDLIMAADRAGKLKTFAVHDGKGRLRALAHFVFTKTYAVYLKGTNFDKSENSGSMHLLMDHAITEFRKEGRIFDFGGGTLPGIGNFFRGMGGEVLPYQKLKFNSLPKWTEWFKRKKAN